MVVSFAAPVDAGVFARSLAQPRAPTSFDVFAKERALYTIG